jgi:hypothetical protein
MKIKYIATAKEWYDKVNNNSYFSVRIKDLKTNKIIYLPLQYGYGTQYEYVTKKVLGLKMRTSEAPIEFIKIDNCKQKDVKEWGKE